MSSITSGRAPATFRQRARGFRHFAPRLPILILLSTGLLSGPGCTTTRAIDPLHQSTTQAGLDAGDTVKATLRDGRKLELVLVEETASHIVARDRTDFVHTIPRDDISFLEVTEISAVRTVLLVGSIALVVGLAQYAAASTAFLTGGW
ncbi:MAG: hypothetical protein ACREQ8_17990 [Woeseiaceae bacterium]